MSGEGERMVEYRAYAYAAWAAVCVVSGLFMFSRACVWALAGDYLQAAFFTLGTIGWIRWAWLARRRWRVLTFAATVRRSFTEMRRTRYCSPPGHTWPGHPVGTSAEPGWCLCGEEFRDQSECDALNWRCEP